MREIVHTIRVLSRFWNRARALTACPRRLQPTAQRESCERGNVFVIQGTHFAPLVPSVRVVATNTGFDCIRKTGVRNQKKEIVPSKGYKLRLGVDERSRIMMGGLRKRGRELGRKQGDGGCKCKQCPNALSPRDPIRPGRHIRNPQPLISLLVIMTRSLCC